MKRIYQIGNVLALVFALIMNYLVGAQVLNVPSIGEISDRYATLLTPATYAFSIWSLIYVLLIGFVIYQARDLFRPNPKNDLPERIGSYFIISSIMNGLWTYVFVVEQISLSVVVLATLVLSQFIILSRLGIALVTPTIKTALFVWWPLLIYTGWVIVALVVNIASWFESIGVGVTSAAAVATLTVLLSVLLFLLVKRNSKELLLSSAWGIAAIGVMQLRTSGGDFFVMAVSFVVAGLLVAATLVHKVFYSNRGDQAMKVA